MKSDHAFAIVVLAYFLSFAPGLYMALARLGVWLRPR